MSVSLPPPRHTDQPRRSKPDEENPRSSAPTPQTPASIFFFSQILFLLRRSFLRLYGVWNNLHHICVSRSSAPTSQMPAITFFFWSASILVSALLEASFVRVFSNIFYPSVYPKPFTMSPCSVCVGLWCCEIPPLCIHYYTRSTPLHLLHTLRV